MPVHVESECGVAMPQEFLHHLHVYAHRHQDGCSPMSQIVESAMWEAGILEELLEHLVQVSRMEIASMLVAEHQVVLLPRSARLQPGLFLVNTMLLQQLND